MITLRLREKSSLFGIKISLLINYRSFFNSYTVEPCYNTLQFNVNFEEKNNQKLHIKWQFFGPSNYAISRFNCIAFKGGVIIRKKINFYRTERRIS